MEPTTEDEKFSKAKMEQAMAELLEKELQEETYDPKTAVNLSKELTTKILEIAKRMGFKRYKFVAQVNIQSNSGQGIRVSSRCLWDPKLDNSATTVFKNETMVIIAMCFGLYVE